MRDINAMKIDWIVLKEIKTRESGIKITEECIYIYFKSSDVAKSKKRSNNFNE